MTNEDLLYILEEPRILKYAIRFKCPHPIATKHNETCTCVVCNEPLQNVEKTKVFAVGNNEDEIRAFIKKELSELLPAIPTLEMPEIIEIIAQDIKAELKGPQR